MSTSTIIGNIEIINNRIQRQWDVVNGSHLGNFPYGEAGRAEAYFLAIQHEDADIHKYMLKGIAKRPSWKWAWIKSAIMAINKDGLSTFDPDPYTIMKIRSSSREKMVHTVKCNDGVITCTCEGFQHRSAPISEKTGQCYCWHIRTAVLLMNVGEIPIPAILQRSSLQDDQEVETLILWQEQAQAQTALQQEDPILAVELAQKRADMKRYRLNLLATDRYQSHYANGG